MMKKTYDDFGNITSTTSHGNGDFYHTDWGLEPRFTATVLLDEVSSIKAGYNRNYQYLHLLSNSTSGNPTDLWIPSSRLVKPEISDQVSVGYFRNFLDNKLEISAEAYYKDLRNQVDYKDGAETLLNPDIEAELALEKDDLMGWS